MFQSIKSMCRTREDAQAMIFFAIVSATLALTTGLAVEGGRAFVQYRKLQNAADLAAIVGAQKLPCTLGSATCATATALACQVAANNGFSTCDGTNSTRDPNAAAAVVPPISCSPYAGLDYGNDSGDGAPYANAACKAANGVSFYDYIEVKLVEDVWRVPVFNVPIQLTAHAIARHGVPSSKDYAVSQLNTAGHLETKGSAEFFVNGSTFANGTPKYNSNTDGCLGGFFTASSGTDHGTTYSSGIAGFAPPKCYNPDGTNAAADSPAVSASNLPPITDPYCTSYSPPVTQLLTLLSSQSTDDCNTTSPNVSAATKIPNCPDCNNYGLYIKNGLWYNDHDISGKNGDSFEMWPGVYTGFNIQNDNVVYMNPGVYTFTGLIHLDKGNVCVYGAPACLSGTGTGECEDPALTFKPVGAADITKGNAWYYNCAPYGYWDQVTKRATSISGSGTAGTVSCPNATAVPLCSPATWWDTSKTNLLGIFGGKGGIGTLPLNGITIYMADQSSLKDTGAGTSDLGWAMPAPNPCPGTGSTFTSGSPGPGAVSFNLGNSAAYYTYSASSANSYLTGSPNQLAYLNGENSWSPVGALTPSHQIISGWGSLVYPSMDLTVAGECDPTTYTYEMWPGEFGVETGAGKPQHLHFAIFNRTLNNFQISGNNGQSYYGVFYTPHTEEQITGAGKTTGGPPWITGQIVSWDITFGGSSAVDLIYRPCNVTSDPCASGLGTQLIQ
jgi:Flp pilus assembly protein TadG